MGTFLRRSVGLCSPYTFKKSGAYHKPCRVPSRRLHNQSITNTLMDEHLLRKLQSVQNATVRLITGTRRCDHITPVLRELHWLSIREHVKFKVACLVRQSLSGQATLYLADDCCLVSDSTRRSLWSANVPACMVARPLVMLETRV